jgi:hemoglobin-like flavoprotein
MMTPRQIDLVQGTWKYVAPKSAETAEMFYGRLAQVSPACRPTFNADATEQGRDLMQTISEHVNSLTMLDTIAPAVEAVGERRRERNSADETGDSVEQALLWTLEQQLGPAYTDDVDQAWTTICESLAETLKTTASARI